jgi:hypothetical protein
MASMDQATQVQRLRTVMPRLLWSLSTHSTEVSTVGTRQLTAVHSMGTPSRHRYELRHNDERRLCDKVRQVSKHLSDGPLAPDAGALLQGNLRVWPPPPAGTSGATKIGAARAP